MNTHNSPFFNELQAVFKFSGDYLHLLDSQGRLILFSDSFASSLGYTREETEGMHLSQWDLDYEEGDFKEKILEFFHHPVLFESRHKRKDGSVFCVEIHATGIEIGGEYFMYASSRDITETKQNRADLAQKEQNYRELFEGVKEVKLVIDAETGMIINANESASRFYGYTVEELCSMPITDINILSKEEVHYEMSRAQKEQREHFHFRHRLAGGEVRDVEVHSGPITYNGRPCLYSIIHDITNRKKAERALELERSRLNALVESVPDLIWFKDTEGRYLYCNSRFENVLGLKHSDVVGKNDYELFPNAGDADFYVENDRIAMLSDTQHITEEYVTFAKDGHSEWLEKIKTAVKDDKGEIIGVLGIGRDITQRKAHEEEVQLLASIFSATHDGIMICDTDEMIIDVNPAFTEIVGYDKNDVIGKTPRILSSGRQSSEFYGEMWSTIYEKGFWKGELWNRNKYGEFYAVQTNISALYDSQGNITHFIGVFSDITSLKTHEERLEHLAHFDQLTLLPNRTLLADRLDVAVSRLKRKKSLLAVCFIDLDGFKPINDTFGHKAGDDVLVEIASRLKDEIRVDDTVARLGGDEFVILLNDLDNPHALDLILHRCLTRIKEPFAIGPHLVQVSASIGVAMTSSSDIEADKLLRQADQAMYRAKQMGRDQFHIFDAAQDAAVEEHHGYLNEIRKGLENGEFELYYQPKVNMVSGEVLGAEALIRWNHPEKGVLPPGTFFPFLKGHDELNVAIDQWVIEQALQQCRTWHENGHRLQISVNITGETLLYPRFITFLKKMLERYPDFRTDCLTFEVLETATLEDIQLASTILNECLQMGFQLSLDDFGTGQSSLTYLRHLPITNVKIDQSFVKDLLTDSEDMVLVESIIGLSKIFNKTFIAEGVESEEIGKKLIEMGCKCAQGYAIARPMTSTQFIEWTGAWTPYRSWQSEHP